MLEAVRLLEPAAAHDSSSSTASPPNVPTDTSATQQALVIGMGIGTAPKAFLQHGIETTIVELDPVVYRFAREYFDLPGNHTAVLEDAEGWVKKEAAAAVSLTSSTTTTTTEGNTHASESQGKKYDYIIHDVFTGGAEPLALFNSDFLSNLRTLLKPSGSIALNYAGDLSLPLTKLVLSTIQQTFSGGPCKIFRDAAPDKHAASKVAPEQDFLNMVVFCRQGGGKITFREARAEDFLGSLSRKNYLRPKAEMEISFPPRSSKVLRAGEEGSWAGVQAESAQRHWRIMRNVLPDAVWELW